MIRRIAATATFLAATALTLPACDGSGSFAKLQETLAQINAKQDEIKTKLDDIEKKIGSAPARPGADANRDQAGRPDPAATYKVPVGDAQTYGPNTAKVTIVEWSDFQCPFCNRVIPTIEQLKKDYGSDLRVAFKHNPLGIHNRALAAAIAAEAAGRQGKFWEFHDKLFANARELTDENFVKWASELGVEIQKFKADIGDPALKKKVEDQQKEGVTLGARGTPAFFVNGRFLSGAQPVEAFKKLIDEEKAKAEKLLASGTAPDKLYDKVIEKGKTKV